LEFSIKKLLFKTRRHNTEMNKKIDRTVDV